MENKKRELTLAPYQKRVEKPWGWEIIYTQDDYPFTGKILHVTAGSRLSLQYHDEKEESLCLINGEAIITISDKDGEIHEITMELNKGYFIATGQKHRITAKTDIDIVESSTPEKGKTYRIEDDSERDTETEEMRKSENRGWKAE